MLMFKVRVILSPHMEEFRGYRMVLAIPNESGPSGGTSFHKRFLVAQSSDYSEMPDLLTRLKWIQEFAGGESVTILKS